MLIKIIPWEVELSQKRFNGRFHGDDDYFNIVYSYKLRSI